jgi:hypothetical protein
MSPAVLGGFNAMLAGRADIGWITIYGSDSYWWSASSNSSTVAWARNVLSGLSQVNRYNTNRAYLFSVRCKMD